MCRVSPKSGFSKDLIGGVIGAGAGVPGRVSALRFLAQRRILAIVRVALYRRSAQIGA